MNLVEVVKKLGVRSITVFLGLAMLGMSVFFLAKQEYGSALCTFMLAAGNAFIAYRDLKKLT